MNAYVKATAAAWPAAPSSADLYRAMARATQPAAHN
jgi:hypothetical protein